MTQEEKAIVDRAMPAVQKILGGYSASTGTTPATQQAIAAAADVMEVYAKWREEHDSQMVDEITEAQESPMPIAVDARKKPRHVSVAINHLLAQRTKAIKVRDKAAEEVESLDAALLALGWGE